MGAMTYNELRALSDEDICTFFIRVCSVFDERVKEGKLPETNFVEREEYLAKPYEACELYSRRTGRSVRIAAAVLREAMKRRNVSIRPERNDGRD